ncbi:uncharacterized protein BKA78DRAFT_171941 [Phyllosticta capitalensis]|uniref:uncharacterized protein n=1 Tax=Phyllosticta capitalensis TaxID=121624 RepID=UPI00312D0992
MYLNSSYIICCLYGRQSAFLSRPCSIQGQIHASCIRSKVSDALDSLRQGNERFEARNSVVPLASMLRELGLGDERLPLDAEEKRRLWRAAERLNCQLDRLSLVAEVDLVMDAGLLKQEVVGRCTKSKAVVALGTFVENNLLADAVAVASFRRSAVALVEWDVGVVLRD